VVSVETVALLADGEGVGVVVGVELGVVSVDVEVVDCESVDELLVADTAVVPLSADAGDAKPTRHIPATRATVVTAATFLHGVFGARVSSLGGWVRDICFQSLIGVGTASRRDDG
jgi:hypothetical protein